jgi:hypothetical protein
MFPDRPFLTDRFDAIGGGIDFLGMRQVTLAMLQDELLPGMNNATRDFGTFCLGAWIPWKFQQLCRRDSKLFVHSRYKKFQEALEIAMAYTMRDDSPADQRFGRPRRRTGIRQIFEPPEPMTFAKVKRGKSTSIYAAPLYGPSLHYVGLIAGNAFANDWSSTKIPLTSSDAFTAEIVQEVDRCLSSAKGFAKVVQLEVPPVKGEVLDDLGLAGLHPSYYRTARQKAKLAFIRIFLGAEQGDKKGGYRRLSAQLLCETLRQYSFSETDDLRACWHTNLLPNGQALQFSHADLEGHRLAWALFQARQIQRTIIENFLQCFEIGVASGCRTLDEVLEYWQELSPPEAAALFKGTFEDLVRSEAAPVSRARDLLAAPRMWHAKVHGSHPLYEDQGAVMEKEELDEASEDNESEAAVEGAELVQALRMLARWWLRMQVWLEEKARPDLLDSGHRYRMSLRWFCEWTRSRLTASLSDLVTQIFSEVIFAQHINVALGRFDGKVQRLRFILGDEGIVPTLEVKDDLGRLPRWTADRLDAFIGILCDLDILKCDADDVLSVGPYSSQLWNVP